MNIILNGHTLRRMENEGLKVKDLKRLCTDPVKYIKEKNDTSDK